MKADISAYSIVKIIKLWHGMRLTLGGAEKGQMRRTSRDCEKMSSWVVLSVLFTNHHDSVDNVFDLIEEDHEAGHG